MDDLSRPLGEIMETPLVSVDIGLTVTEALAVARSHDIHHLPIRDGDVLAGVTCVCDLVDLPMDAPVSRGMTTAIKALSRDDSALDAAELMKKTGVGSVLVLDGDDACGIVTRGNVMAWAAEADDVLENERCDCCGLAQHLHRVEGRLLCAFCRGSETEKEWWHDLAVSRP